MNPIFALTSFVGQRKLLFITVLLTAGLTNQVNASNNIYEETKNTFRTNLITLINTAKTIDSSFFQSLSDLTILLLKLTTQDKNISLYNYLIDIQNISQSSINQNTEIVIKKVGSKIFSIKTQQLANTSFLNQLEKLIKTSIDLNIPNLDNLIKILIYLSNNNIAIQFDDYLALLEPSKYLLSKALLNYKISTISLNDQYIFQNSLIDFIKKAMGQDVPDTTGLVKLLITLSNSKKDISLNDYLIQIQSFSGLDPIITYYESYRVSLDLLKKYKFQDSLINLIKTSQNFNIIDFKNFIFLIKLLSNGTSNISLNDYLIQINSPTTWFLPKALQTMNL